MKKISLFFFVLFLMEERNDLHAYVCYMCPCYPYPPSQQEQNPPPPKNKTTYLPFCESTQPSDSEIQSYCNQQASCQGKNVLGGTGCYTHWNGCYTIPNDQCPLPGKCG